MNPDLKLMPFQEEGSTLLAKTQRGMLVWDAGIGKTPTAVRACVKARAERILVFCPPIATGVWRKHFEDWSEYQIRVLNAGWNHKPGGFLNDYGARIIPYSRAHSDADVIKMAAKAYTWDAVILDEAHYLKNPEAKRSQAVYGRAFDLKDSPLEKADRIWCLTGTPLLNNPSEFWTHLHALAPDTIILGPTTGVMTHGVFTDRYCVTRPTSYGIRIIGTRNSSDLAHRIRKFAFRKRTKDVLLDLPPLRIVEHPLPADTPISDELAATMNDFLDHEGPLDDDDLLAAFQAGGVQFSTMRRLVGMAKAPGVAALVDDILEDAEGEKVIVFAHHREVISWLAQQLRGHLPLVITGATSPKTREQLIDTFQTTAGHRLIILAIEAAGEAITLHAARNVVIAEPSPVPAKNFQAIARAHRKGQKNPVVARFVTLPGGLDALLTSIIARKTRGIAQVVDADLARPLTELFPQEI
jgi:SWI/SNF-related matrix-associated actin-dependent regulator of chromatin subfamily A-like protein 1